MKILPHPRLHTQVPDQIDELIVDLQTDLAYHQYLASQPNIAHIRPATLDEHLMAIKAVKLIKEGRYDDLQRLVDGFDVDVNIA